MDDDEDQEFWDLIQSVFNPPAVGDGDGWVIAEVLEGVFDVTCAPDLTAQMEATKCLIKNLGVNIKKAVTTHAFPLEDGRVSVCYLKKA